MARPPKPFEVQVHELLVLDKPNVRRFFRIEQRGERVFVTSGHIGTNGRRETLVLPDEGAATNARLRLYVARREAGYRVVPSDAAVHEKSYRSHVTSDEVAALIAAGRAAAEKQS